MTHETWRAGWIAALLVAVASITAEADIYRGCTGILSLGVVSGTGKVGSHTHLQLDAFEGRGACKNRLQANTCRTRAKDNIFRCANDVWNQRWNLVGDPNDGRPDEGLPDSCLGRATGAKGLGPFKENPHGQFFDIKHAIEHAGCCRMQPEARSLHLMLTVNSGGDKGCGNDRSPYGGYREQRILEDNYMVDCERARARGMCAVRSSPR